VCYIVNKWSWSWERESRKRKDKNWRDAGVDG